MSATVINVDGIALRCVVDSSPRTREDGREQIGGTIQTMSEKFW